MDKFKEGAISGLLSSLTTTICNIFFTTAKNIVKIIRYAYEKRQSISSRNVSIFSNRYA